MNSALLPQIADEEFLAITADLLSHFAGNHTLQLTISGTPGMQVSLAITGKGGAVVRKVWRKR